MRLRRGTQWGATSLLLCLILWGLLSITCSEAPFQPDDENLKDYRAWFWDGINRDKLFWFHTATGEVDSAIIPILMSGNPTVSHDGKRIYVRSDEIVKVLETDSFSVVGEIPHFAEYWIVVSPNGQYVAMFGDSTWIVRTSDYSNIFVDSSQSFTGCFSKDGLTLYTAEGTLRRISLADPEQIIVDTLREYRGYSQVAPTPDESKLAVYYPVQPYVSAFGVYDIALDTILNYDMQMPGVGRFAMTPDGKLAFYGNPGNGLGPKHTSELTVYDIESNRMLMRWNMDGLVDEFLPLDSPIGEMVVSPDGRWLLALRGPINQSQTIIQWDIYNERIEGFYLGYAVGISIQLVE